MYSFFLDIMNILTNYRSEHVGEIVNEMFIVLLVCHRKYESFSVQTVSKSIPLNQSLVFANNCVAY